eukprot:gene19349-25998_t
MPQPTSSSSGWIPQHHRDISLGRLDGFVSSDMFSDANICKDMYLTKAGGSYTSLEVYSVPMGNVNPKFTDIVDRPFVACKVGDSFGPSWSTHWFRVRIDVPPSWSKLDGPLVFIWDSGSEAMVWVDGEAMQGITDQRNEYTLLSDGAPAGGVSMALYVEMVGCCMQGDGDGIKPPDPEKYFTLKEVDVAVPNVPVVQLYHDLLAITDIARSLPPDSDIAMDALFTANAMVNTYRSGDPKAVEASRMMASKFLGNTTASRRHTVYALGHCHIDTAWLWPF